MFGEGCRSGPPRLRAGRLAALDPDAFTAPPSQEAPPLDELRALFIARLTAWQDAAYAARFAALVDGAAARVAGWPDAEPFVRALMQGAHHVMAWKDEYEVARLHADPAFHAMVAEAFEGDYRLVYHLAPPFLSRLDPRSGRPAKRRFGPWMRHGFRLLARLKRLRGTPFDPFGYAGERRAERALRDDYLRRMEALVARLVPADLADATEAAAAVLEVRGFGPVKAANLARYQAARGKTGELGETGKTGKTGAG